MADVIARIKQYFEGCCLHEGMDTQLKRIMGYCYVQRSSITMNRDDIWHLSR